MTSRIGSMALSGLILTWALTASSSVWAQVGFQTGPGSQYGQGSILGYGSVGGRGFSPYSGGYNVGNGQVGAGYQSAARFQYPALPSVRPQTTIAFQPLYSAITALPGWSGSGSSYRVRRRLPRSTSQPSIPRAHLMDENGTIRWPSALPNDPSLTQARQAAEAAVRTVVQESKTTGHASIRPVIDAKNQLTAFAEKALPLVKVKNAADADALDAFFSQLGKALDTMALSY
jgi:hypothetical protein